MDPRHQTIAALKDLIAFYRDIGVEDAIDEAPHDRFAEDAEGLALARSAAGREAESRRDPRDAPAQRSATAALPQDRVLATTPDEPPRAIAPVAPAEAERAAGKLAREAVTLEQLRAALEAFDGCALKASARKLVFGDGNPDARLMLVGEPPDMEDDQSGVPFDGPAGHLLDLMLKAIGLDRTQVYLANVIPWRPPGNRKPTQQESAICKPFIARQIALCNPDILICLGAPPAEMLLDKRDSIATLRGSWHSYDTGKRRIRAMITFPPALLLRNPAQKRRAWADFKAIRRALVELPPRS